MSNDSEPSKVINRTGFSFFKDFMYLFLRDTERGRGRGRGRGRSGLYAGSPTRDSIPGPRVTPWTGGRRSTTQPPGRPQTWVFNGLRLCQPPGVGSALRTLRRFLQELTRWPIRSPSCIYRGDALSPSWGMDGASRLAPSLGLLEGLCWHRAVEICAQDEEPRP